MKEAIDGAPLNEPGYEYRLPGYPGGGDGWQSWVPHTGWVDGPHCEDSTRRRPCEGVDKPRAAWDEMDTSRMDNVVCPYCGFVDRDGWELFGSQTDCGEADNECYRCGREYTANRQLEVVYSTKRKEE
jgi:DNA-directed RNA polymerase subunit RPC12/RpoP